jgi:ATP-binding cassette subfamily B protein
LSGGGVIPESKTTTDRGLLWRLLAEGRPYWWHLAGIFWLGLLATPVSLLAPLPLKIAVDSALGSRPLPDFLDAIVPDALSEDRGELLVLSVLLVVAVALLTQLQWTAYWFLSTYAGEKLVLQFRSRLFQHVQRLSIAFHDKQGTTDSTYRIQYDAPSIQHILIDGLIPFISSLVKLLGMLWVMSLIDTQLALVALTVTPVLFLLTRAFRGRLRGQWREVKQHESSALTVVQEALGALRVVQAFGQEEREQSRFVSRSTESVGARLRAVISESSFGVLVGLTTAIGTALVLWLGIRHVEAGVISLGELLMAMAYVGQLYDPLKKVSTQLTGLQRSFASAERAFELLDRVPQVRERPNPRPLRRAGGAVEFEQVSFGYEPGALVLREVAFQIPPGTRVGIAGRTGAGKTTLINLLTRFFDPETGRILLDGVDLRDYRLADLRGQFGMVLQDPVLLSTSIAENIAYAAPGASENQIIAAAQAAGAHEFITQFEKGYDTLVGERGMRLSGGERQRIGLARAFLKDAPILILDEPTSSVDVQTEAGILEAMNRLMEGRTTFMIAHRLGTLRNCNQVLLVEGGGVSPVGGSLDDFIRRESNAGRESWPRTTARAAAEV